MILKLDIHRILPHASTTSGKIAKKMAGKALDGVYDIAKDETKDVVIGVVTAANVAMDGKDDNEDDSKDEGHVHFADVMIGIANSQRLNEQDGGFWLKPIGGFAYYGFNGQKYNWNKKGLDYASPFTINDQISIELNMDMLEVGFYINGEYQGKAFDVMANDTYCLAISMDSPDFDIQIV